MAKQTVPPAIQKVRNARIASIREIAALLEGADQASLDQLTNDQVWAFITSVEGDALKPDDDKDMERASLLVNAEPVHHDAAEGEGVVTEKLSVNIAAAHPVRSKAVDAARKLGESAEFETITTRLEGAKDALSMGPLEFFDIFVAVYGGGDRRKAMAHINGDDKNIGWPIAGTQSTPKDGKPGSNNPDKFQVSYSKGDGSSGTRQTSFFAELYDATPHGMKIRDMLNELNKGDQSEVSEYVRMHPTVRNQTKARISGWRNTSVGNLRRCRKLFTQLSEIEKVCGDQVRVEIARVIEWDKAKQQNVTTKVLLNTPKPIIVGTTADWEHRELFSIGSFLGWRPDMIKEKSLVGLKATVNRKGKAGSGQAVNLSQLPTLQIAEQQALLQLTAFDNADWADKFDKMARTKGSESMHAAYFGLHKELAYRYGPQGEFHKVGSDALAAASQKDDKTKAA